jgi:hypothetical protein
VLVNELEASGEMPSELEEIELPGETVNVHEAFWRLFGAEPLTWQEIGAYCSLTGEVFEEWEMNALIRMDRAVRDEQMKRRTTPEGAPDAR